MHLHFGSDDEEAGRGAPAALPASAPSHVGLTGSGFQSVANVRVDFDRDQTYVFELAHSSTGIVAAALSNKRIKLFQFRWGDGRGRGTSACLPPLPPACRRRRLQAPLASTPLRPRVRPPCPRRSEGGLQFVGDLVGHEGMLRELAFDLPDQPHLLHSAGADGSVRGWDTRAGQEVERCAAAHAWLAGHGTHWGVGVHGAAMHAAMRRPCCAPPTAPHPPTPPPHAMPCPTLPPQPRRYSAPRLELLSCSTNGALVAAGGGDKVLFWDRRTQVGRAPWWRQRAQSTQPLAWGLHEGPG